jgi:hypothetical protein
MSRSSDFAGSDTGAGTMPARGDGSSRDATERLKAKASNLREQAEERARSMAERQKRAGAERVGSMARAVRDAAGNLEREMPAAAEFIQNAARQIEEKSADYRDRSIDEIFSEVAAFARRQPALFFGGALLAGFVLSRFLKSSPPERSADDFDQRI